MKKLLIFVLAIGVCILFANGDNASAKDKVYKWRAVTHQLVGTSRYEGTVVPFCDMVKKASGGRLIIEPYGAGVLFPVTESLGCRQGRCRADGHGLVRLSGR